MYSGAYLPLLREDILHLLEQLDKIADGAESCCDFFWTNALKYLMI